LPTPAAPIVIAPGDSAAVANRLAPGLVPSPFAVERPITVDQTNHSVVVAEAAVVKWLRPPRPDPHRGARLMTHLAEVGFVDMPAFLGAHVVDGMVVALVTAYLDGARDGWEWYVDLMTEELDGVGPARSVSVGARLGSLAARLHQALATRSSVIDQPVGWSDASVEHRRGVALLDEALAVTGGEAGARLEARADRIRADLDVLAGAGPLEVQHVHGDLHVGQVLRRHDDLVVTDFDGTPVGVGGDGDGVLRTPLVDLASLVQSVDHVGRIVARRRPELAGAASETAAEAVAAVIAAYGRAGPVDHVHRVDHAVLDALRTTQELHELVYAAEHLPRWPYVPDAALAARYP
jgi:maltokinase